MAIPTIGIGASIGDRARIRLYRRPVGFVAALRAERTNGVDRLRSEADMAG